MKKILVPTDFSACAGYAMESGLLFADKFDAELCFVNILSKNPSKKASYHTPEELAQEKHNVEVLFSEWRDKSRYAEVKFISKTKRGPFLEKLKECVEEFKPDFIIMGSHGTSGKKEYFIGSNTQKAVRTIHRPFLIVKDSFKEIVLEKVVFASSFNESDKGPFKYFLGLMEPFYPEIHLVAINTFNWFSQPYLVLKEAMKDFKSIAKAFHCESHFFSDLSVEAGIKNFSYKLGADLIVVSNLERHPIKRILSGSTVEALVNHSKLPVLSIDYPS